MIHDEEVVPCLVDYLINGQVVRDAWIRTRFWVVRHGDIERTLLPDW